MPSQGDRQFVRQQTSGLENLARQWQAFLRFGEGAPTADPGVDRVIYINRTGALGAILYVWDGTVWTAFA